MGEYQHNNMKQCATSFCHNMMDHVLPNSDGMINTAPRIEDGIQSKNTPSNPDIATDVTNKQFPESSLCNVQDHLAPNTHVINTTAPQMEHGIKSKTFSSSLNNKDLPRKKNVNY